MERKASKDAGQMARVVGYARVSTTEQAMGGVSLEAQQAAIRSYCDLRGLELVEIVTDPGVSAGKPLASRPGGARVTKLVASGEVAGVVALKIDRVFRNCENCLATLTAWDRRGVSAHFVDLGGSSLDTASPMGRFMLTIMAAAAEMERGLVAERTRTALEHKRAKGERVGQIAYGFKLAADGVALEQDPDEQRVIALIVSMRQAGLSIAAIAERLNAEHVRARGTKWHPTSVRRVLVARAA